MKDMKGPETRYFERCDGHWDKDCMFNAHWVCTVCRVYKCEDHKQRHLEDVHNGSTTPYGSPVKYMAPHAGYQESEW